MNDLFSTLCQQLKSQLARCSQPSFLHRVPIPTPFLYARDGRQKQFERGNYPPPPRYSAIQPNHIKFRTCSALAPMRTPPINGSGELTRGALQLIQYSEAVNYPVCKVVLALGDEVGQDYFLRQVHTLEVSGYFSLLLNSTVYVLSLCKNSVSLLQPNGLIS